MISISKNKKLNYLLNIDLKIIDKIKISSKDIETIIFYIRYSKFMYDSVNQRIKLIKKYNQSKNRIYNYYDFYNEYLFPENILEIIIYLKFQNYYLDIILNKWNVFNSIINNFMTQYLD